MKRKISVTVDRSLLDFVDSLPGESRSQKVEKALQQFKKLIAEKELRSLLGGYREDDKERIEREVWENTIAEAMWSE